MRLARLLNLLAGARAPAGFRLFFGFRLSFGLGRCGFFRNRQVGHRRFARCDFASLVGHGVGLAAPVTATTAASALRLLAYFFGAQFFRLGSFVSNFGKLIGRIGGRFLAFLGVPAASASTPATATATATASFAFLFTFGPALGLFRLDLVLFGQVVVLFLNDDRRYRSDFAGLGTGTGAFDRHPGTLEGFLDGDVDRDSVTMLDLGQFTALLVKHVDGGLAAGPKHDPFAAPAGCLVLNDPQRAKTGGGCGAHKAGALAMRASLGRCFQDTGAEPLAAHFHEAKAGDAADLDPGAIVLQRLLHGLFDLPDMARLFHVDEVDDDEPRHVAQAKLASDFRRRFEVGRERGLLDIMLARRPAGVDVDRYQRLGRIDHQITAGFQLDDRLIHCRQLVFDAEPLEDGGRVDIRFYPPHMARHQQLHEAARRLIALVALDHDFLDLTMIKIADGPLDEVAVPIDQGRGRRRQGTLANFVPQAGKIVEVALDLDLCPLEARGPDDEAHSRRKLQVVDDRLQPLSVGAVRDFAADSAAVRRIGHQHAIAAGKAQIGGKRRTLVAALFLDDLHQQDLPALDNVLDLVPAAKGLALLAKLLGGAFIHGGAGRAGSDFGCFLALGFGIARILSGIFNVLDLVVIILGRTEPLFFGCVLCFLGQQRIAVCFRDLIIVGMDFAEGQEAVAVSTVIDERRLKRRFDAGNLG